LNRVVPSHVDNVVVVHVVNVSDVSHI
jgi:hypothetical protein